MNAELLLQIGGVSIPIGGAIVYLAKRAVETILSQHQRIMDLRLSQHETKMQDLNERIGTMNGIFRDLSEELRKTGDRTIRNTLKIEELEKALTKHASVIEVALPAIKSEIGKLSMYWKQTGQK